MSPSDDDGGGGDGNIHHVECGDDDTLQVSNNDVLLEPCRDFCLATIEPPKQQQHGTTTTTATAFIGNNRFRILVDMNRKAYSDATNDEEKKAVVSKLIDIICNQFSPEGRFLERKATPVDPDKLLSKEDEEEGEGREVTTKTTERPDGRCHQEGTLLDLSCDEKGEQSDGSSELVAQQEATVATVAAITKSPLTKFSWRQLDLDESFYRVEQALQAGVTMDYPKSVAPPDAAKVDVASKVPVGEEEEEEELANDDDDDAVAGNVETSKRPSQSPLPKHDMESSPETTDEAASPTTANHNQQRRRSSMASIAESAFSLARVFPRRRSSAVDIAAANERRRRRRSSTIGSITETILVALLGSDARRGSSAYNGNNSNINSTNTTPTTNTNGHTTNNNHNSSKDAGKRRKKHLIEENYDDVLDDLLIPLQSASQGQRTSSHALHPEMEFDYVGGSARELQHGALLDADEEDFVTEYNNLDVIISYDGTQLDARCNNPGNIRIKILMDNQQGSFWKLAPTEQRRIAAELVDTVQNHWSGRCLKSGIRKDHPYLVLTTSQAELALHALLLKRSRKVMMTNGNNSSSTSSPIENPLSASTIADNEARLPALQETEDDDNLDSSTFALGPKVVAHETAALSPPPRTTWRERKWSGASSTSSSSSVKPPPKTGGFKLPTLNSLQQDAIQTLQARKQRSMQRQRINRGGANKNY